MKTRSAQHQLERSKTAAPARSRGRVRVRKARFASALAAVVMIVFGAVPAFAANDRGAEAERAVTIRKVDTSRFPTVELIALRPPTASAADKVKISENGSPITNLDVKSVAEADVSVGVVLAIDTSESMKDGDALTKAKAAAIELVHAKTDNEQFALVAFNGIARRVINFTSDKQAILDGIDTLKPSNDAALWSGLSVSAAMFDEDSAAGMQANIVVISGSADKLSTEGAYERALSAVRTANAAVFPIVIKQRAVVNADLLSRVATETGGRYLETADPGTATQLLTGVGKNISEQVVVTYKSLAKKSLEIEVAIGNGLATAHISPGTIAEGAAVSPVVIETSPLPTFMTGSFGLAIVALISLLGVGLLGYGVIEIVGNERNQLSRALRPYSDEQTDERDFSKIADSEIIKKAVASTARLANNRGLLQIIQSKLEQADLPLRPAEALFFTGVAALVAMVVGAALNGILGFAAAGLLFAYLPIMVTGLLAKRRRKKFTSQLPDTLQLLAGSLRAGYSLVQGLDAVAKQCSAPMGTELQRAMSEARLGRPVEEALQEVSDRMGSDDFEWAVMAIKIQREVGGNLAELLVTVSETMVARERLRREVKALTAEGRISAIVLTFLPFGIGATISVLNPAYMQPLFGTSIGQAAIVIAVLMVIIGYVVMTKLIEIEA